MRDERTYTLNPFGRLAVTQALSMVGDACLTVSLAGSIFFSQDLGKSRTQVLLYLALTLAPFTIVGPVVGPLLDRSRLGRRTLLALGSGGRAALCFFMATHLHDLLLYPLAFGVLVLSKGGSVAKSSLVPAVVGDDSKLVEANSRLALIGVAASIGGGLPAAGIVAVFDARWSLYLAAVVQLAASVCAMRIPHTGSPALAETPDERAGLDIPSINLAGTAMAVLRGGVGFLTAFAAFSLKRAGEPAWFYGLVIVASAVGGLLGVVGTPKLRSHVREESMLASALIAPAIIALLSAREGGRIGFVVTAAVLALGASSGRIAFDSLLHRDGPDHVRGRAFARYETRFQLAWVVGALIPVAVLDILTKRVGFFVLALVLAFAGMSYIGALRARYAHGPSGEPPPAPGRDPDEPGSGSSPPG